MSDLTVPDVTGADTVEASLAYAAGGFYVVPLLAGEKNPGSVLGKGWPALSSRDPAQIVAWFAGTDHGPGLHLGRSGAAGFDVDAPLYLPAVLRQAIADTAGPYQSTRPDTPGRGHYLYAVSRRLGNGKGQLGGGWGEVRGHNGIIVVQPTPHSSSRGEYRWVRTGPVPPLPAAIDALLPDGNAAGDAATDAEVDRFYAAHTAETRPGLLDVPLTKFQAAVAAGESSHETAVIVACWLAREAACGYYPAPKALDLLRVAFECSFPSSTGRPRPGPGEWRGIEAWAVGQVTDEEVGRTRERIEASQPSEAAGGDADDDDEFWTARPILDYIHAFARARRVAPWAALAEVLVRVTTAAEWKLRLPALIGGEASLAIYAALVGASGAGKGAATRAARAAVAFTGVEPFAEVNLGSGQGIAHAFAERPRPTKDNPKPGINLHTRTVLFTVPEVATLGALAEAKGSPLLPELTKAWTGEALGFMYVDRDKRLPLPELSYRLGLVVGVQPDRAGVLLDDADAGTPQRFIWMGVGDPHMPDRKPDCPPRWVWTHPVLYGEPPIVDVCTAAADAIDHAHLARQRAAVDEAVPEALDGHLLLCRLKVAAALGLLDGRTSVSDEDWQLAGVVIDHSLHVRRQVVAVLGDRKRQANRGQAKAEAERAAITEDAAEDRGLRHAEDWIIKQLTGRRSVDGGWMTARELSRSVGDRNKPWLRAALERLVDTGRIEAEPTRPAGGGRASVRYRMPR